MFKEIHAKESYGQYRDKVHTIIETVKKQPEIFQTPGQINYAIKTNPQLGSAYIPYASIYNYRIAYNELNAITNSSSCLGGTLRTTSSQLVCPVSIQMDKPSLEYSFENQYQQQEYLWFKFKTKNSLYKLAGLPFDDVEYGAVIKKILTAYAEVTNKVPTITFGRNNHDVIMRLQFNNSSIYEGYVFGCLIRNTWCLESHYSTFSINDSVEEMFAKNILHTLFHYALANDTSFTKNNLFVLRGSDGNNYSCPPINPTIASNFDKLVSLLPKTFNFNNLKQLTNAYGYYTT